MNETRYHVVVWKWNQPGFHHTYTAEHVNVMNAMLQLCMKDLNWVLHVITDEPTGINGGAIVHKLWDNCSDVKNPSGRSLPSCYRRLRIFDPEIQQELGIEPGDRIINLDLDSIVMGPLHDIIRRKERFVAWIVRGAYHVEVINGSFWMFTAGDLKELWYDFDPQTTPKTTHTAGYMGSDQAWLSYRLINNPKRKAELFGWRWPFFASYPREIRRMRVLDRRTRIVFFHGQYKPWHQPVQLEAPWIKRYWRLTP